MQMNRPVFRSIMKRHSQTLSEIILYTSATPFVQGACEVLGENLILKKVQRVAISVSSFSAPISDIRCEREPSYAIQR